MSLQTRIKKAEERVGVEKQQFEVPIIRLPGPPSIPEPVTEWLTYKQRPTAKAGCLPPAFIADPRREHEARLRMQSGGNG